VRPSREAVAEWIVERLGRAKVMLREAVEADPDTQGGVVVLRGTRFPIARVLAELAEDSSISDIAGDFDLDIEILKKFLQGMAVCLERPAVE
jgi:uncharacterized protein (DUF433 family)